jgi:hypothetical protein
MRAVAPLHTPETPPLKLGDLALGTDRLRRSRFVQTAWPRARSLTARQTCAAHLTLVKARTVMDADIVEN